MKKWISDKVFQKTKLMYNFQISTFQTELILGVNLLTHSLFAFFAGFIGEKYGKKKAINVGMIIFIFASAIPLIMLSLLTFYNKAKKVLWSLILK
jgi:MFS family permease